MQQKAEFNLTPIIPQSNRFATQGSKILAVNAFTMLTALLAGSIKQPPGDCVCLHRRRLFIMSTGAQLE